MARSFQSFLTAFFAFFRAGTQRLTNGLVRLHNGRLLTHPGKLVALVPVHHIRGEHLLEHLKIAPSLDLAIFITHLGDTVRKQGGDAVYVL